MRRGGGWVWVALSVSVLCPAVAGAQRPVCPPPAVDHVVYDVCTRGGALWMARFLADFAVDHAFKPMPPPLKRAPREFYEVLAQREIQHDEQLSAYVDGLAPLAFTKLDTSTGVFEGDVAEAHRRFTWTREGWATRYKFSLLLPEELSGGYWRTPGALELAFWERNRVRFKLGSDEGIALRMALACVSIAPGSVRLVPADGSPQVIINIAACR